MCPQLDPGGQPVPRPLPQPLTPTPGYCPSLGYYLKGSVWGSSTLLPSDPLPPTSHWLLLLPPLPLGPATRLELGLSRIIKGSGNPLQCSCLENPMGGGAS